MIILCDNCKAKYRLSEDKIAGKGARVKCRKCSDYIIVMKPEYEHLKREFIDGIRADELKRAAEEKEETREVDEAEREVESPVETPLPREDEREEEEERVLTAGESAEEDIAGMKAQEEDPGQREEVPEEPFKAEAVSHLPEEDDEEREAVAIDEEEPDTPEVTEKEDEVPKDDIDLAFERFLGSLREDSKIPEDSFEQPDYFAEEKQEPIVEQDATEEVAPPSGPEESAEEKPEILSSSETLQFLSKDEQPDEKYDPFDLKLKEEKLDIQSPADFAESMRPTPDVTEEAGWRPPVDVPTEEIIDSRTETPPDTPTLDMDAIGARTADREQRVSDMRFEEPSLREPVSPYEFVPKTITMKRKKSKLAGFLMMLLIFLLAVAGAGAYLAFTEPGNEIIIKYTPYVRSFLGLKDGQGASQFDIANLIGYYETNRNEGKVFVIKGNVVNLSKTVASGIVLKGQLLGVRNRVLEEKKVYAGNPLDNKMLRNSSKKSIEEALQNKLGKNLSNIDIQPGSSVPFMVVFFDLPEKIEAYKVESIN